MPYITDNDKLQSPFLKGNCKLLPCQKEMIHWWRQRGLTTYQLAEMYNVSRRTIQFVLDPDKLKKNKERREERGGSSAYYDRESHNEAIKKHRKKKYELLKHTHAKDNSESSSGEL
jgi:IS30 family transposase